jgi:hypothetical protein
MGKDTKVRLMDKDFYFPDYDELNTPKKRTIGDIVDCKGAFDVVVEADIVSISILEGRDKEIRMVELDDGTGVISLKVNQKEKGGEEDMRWRIGMPVRARGNVVESKHGYGYDDGYVMMAKAEEAEILDEDEALVNEEMRCFLCRYV